MPLLADHYFMPRLQIPGYGSFFKELMEVVSIGEMGETLAQSIEAHALELVKKISPSCLPYAPEAYLRNYIGRDEESGWEAILMSWSSGNRTSIHSHPQFASYTFGHGRFLIEIFEPAEGSVAAKTAEIEVGEGQSFHSIGEAGLFDNHIHRITCLSDTGFSLHIYSDDALKGYKFDEHF